MKKIFGLILAAGLLMSLHELNGGTCGTCPCTCPQADFLDDVNNVPETDPYFDYIANVAQYKLANWDNVVRYEQHISLEEAKQIAYADPNITFFFYTKGYRMVLENLEVNPPIYRIFENGDTVFFSGAPWWGTAPGLADGYIKKGS